MNAENIILSQSSSISLKLKDYSQLVKLRLNLTVVFSTFIGFLLGAQGRIHWLDLLIVCLGGFLTVGAANGINQIIERDSDKLMRRTENRPIAQGRMSILEACITSLILGTAGVYLIAHYLSPLCGILSFLSLVSYAFIYTPLKKVTPLNVYIGAFPGAVSPIIGYAASKGSLDMTALCLFVIQFVWQFPHFYSISWLLDDDYKRAGLKMMPLGAKKDKAGAIQIVAFTAILLPLSFLPYFLGLGSVVAAIVLEAASLYFFFRSIMLLKDLSNLSSKKLMFTSFFYLPLVFIIMLIDKLI
jgi:protoheme IX farnesyltransferase